VVAERHGTSLPSYQIQPSRSAIESGAAVFAFAMTCFRVEEALTF
jgi:hypothetical protein